MARVRKGNVIQEVDDAHVQSYVSRGYDVISDGGAVLQRAVPTDIGTLQKAYTDYAAKAARVKDLEGEVALLRQEIEEMQETGRKRSEEMQEVRNRNAELLEELDALKSKKRASKKDVPE